MSIAIYTIGDSHSSAEHSFWGTLKIPNVEVDCFHERAMLMHSFNKHFKDQSPINVDGITNFDRKHYIIFCFGEIDCRNHVHKYVSKERTYKDVIDELVIDYINIIVAQQKLHKNITYGAYNIVPPFKYSEDDFQNNPDLPAKGSNTERQSYVIYMNSKLKELCEINNLLFFDIYKESCDEDGFLQKRKSDGNVHIKHREDAINFIKKNML